jgi:uncharacterized protein YkwD
MVRAGVLATLIAGVLAAAGCGEDRVPAGAVAPPAAVPVTASVEPTDGRLGDATAVEPGASRSLSRGGKPDVSERDDAPSRDGVGAGAACPDGDLAPSAETMAAVAAATLCLLNGERADQGLAPLATNAKLTTAAAAYAQDLVAGSYFSHTGRDGSDVLDRIKRTGYIRADRAWRIGENLAWGTGGLATPSAIVRAWMNSPGHRENILNGAYREIGVGVVAGNPARTDGAGATYATEFGVTVAEAALAPPAAKQARGKKARASKRGKAARAKAARGKSGRAKAARAKAARAKAARAKAARGKVAGKGRGKGAKRRVKGRGPVARIAI